MRKPGAGSHALVRRKPAAAYLNPRAIARSMRHAEEPITLIVGVSPGGIGAAIARRLARDGHHLVLASRRVRVLDPLTDELNEHAGSVRVLRSDATKPRHANHVMDDILVHYGRLDNLVYTPGRPITGPFLDTPVDALDVQLQENTRAPWQWLQTALPVMQEHGGGTLVFLSSTAGHQGLPHLAAYSAAKHALHGLIESVAAEHQESLIKPVALILDGELERDEEAEEPHLGIDSATPIRLADVAQAVAHVIEQDALAVGTEHWVKPREAR